MARAHRRTRSPSLRAMTRWRSNLISCSQPGPDGGLSASPGCRRRIKPRGLATRAHRPRRTPQHAGDIAAGAAERESCPLSADTVEKHIVLVFSGSRIRPEWRDVRDHVWSGLSNVGALQRTCGTIYLRTSDAACLGKISRDAQLWRFSTTSAHYCHPRREKCSGSRRSFTDWFPITSAFRSRLMPICFELDLSGRAIERIFAKPTKDLFRGARLSRL
jgi:hypothetical protein